MKRHRFNLEIIYLISQLRNKTKKKIKPMSFLIIDQFGKDPFLLLISCLLSLRARDAVTLPVSLKLFSQVRTPQDVLDLSLQYLELLIYPVGFYKRKAFQIKQISNIILDQYGGQVPNTETELLRLPGVGIKTANLVLGMAFDIPAICVDIHVHRISNRLGIVTTKTPEQTEKKLKIVLPKEYWIEWNRLLVTWGQNVCPRKQVCELCDRAQLRKR
ncbi:MAG: endonuclease-3 [Alteromonas naphthalenivorans]|jgi:endonuclease-3